MELNLIIAIWAFAFMTAFAAWILGRHFRCWMWTREVRWNFHRKNTLFKIRVRMLSELGELERNAPGEKHPKKKKAYGPTIVMKQRHIDDVSWEYSEVMAKLEQLLEKGPP